MIQIKIDKKNIAFRDFHYEKIKNNIQSLLIKKRNSYLLSSLEYQVLNWINSKLDLILKGQPKELRSVISDFNSYIKAFLSTEEVTIDKDNKGITVDILKEICKENSIKGFSGKNKEELIKLVNTAKVLRGNTIDELKFNNLKNKINFIIKEVFEKFYENEWDKIKDYNRYIFIKKHNLKTCPYCNMGYILVSEKDNNDKNGLRPEIDHFFPKSKYPYLAMSFYNLIPSCKVCNHSKGNKDTYADKLLSPYEIDKNTFKLTYKLKSLIFYKIKKRKYLDNSELEVKFKKIDKQSDEYFKLEKLYKQHKDVVLELLLKKIYYPDSYIKELKTFGFSKDEIYRHLLCNYKQDEDLHKRPLSKLIKDISEELGLL